MSRNYRIPEKISIYEKPERDFETWDKRTVRVKPSMVINAESKTSPSTAKAWQGHVDHYGLTVYDEKGLHVLDDANEKVYRNDDNLLFQRTVDSKRIKNEEAYKANLRAPYTITNGHIEYLHVLDLEHRGEGGRAYKVITPENLMFDLREDVVLDIMFARGVEAGGKITGPFQWAICGSQMKILLVGSDDYNQAAKEKAISQKTKIKLKDLVIGGVYANTQTQVVYLGEAQVEKGNKRQFVFENVYWNSDKYDPDLVNYNPQSGDYPKRHIYSAESMTLYDKIGQCDLKIGDSIDIGMWEYKTLGNWSWSSNRTKSWHANVLVFKKA